MSAAKPGRQAGAFSAVTMLALVLVGIFSFAAFLTLSAFEPELNNGRNGRAHALSQSAVGYAGLVKLMQARGDWVSIHRGARGPEPAALAILTPEAPLERNDLQGVPAMSRLIVLPKWFVGGHPTHRGWVMRAGAAPEPMVARLVSDLAPKLEVNRRTGRAQPDLVFYGKDRLRAGPIDQLQTISGAGIEPVVTDENGAIVLGSIQAPDGAGLFILAEPDFFNTQGVANLDNARAALAIVDSLHAPDSELIFDVTINGLGRARNVLRLAFEPPFLAATLALAAAALLLAWRAAVRTGPGQRTERAIALGKAALADNSAALIRLTGREKRMGAGYAALTGAGVAELIGAARAENEDTARLLDTVGAAQGVKDRYSDLAADAAAAQTPQRMLDAAKKLHAWKEEMLRAIR